MVVELPRRTRDTPRDGITFAAADVGSIRAGKFGWAICDDHGCLLGDQIQELASELVRRLDVEQARIALGFEAPLYVPVVKSPEDVGRPRQGEFVEETRSGKPKRQARPF